MIRLLSLLLLFLLTTQARENPFFPSKGEVDIPFSSNIDRSLSPLKRATVSVPSQARAIKKVTIEYINLDGSTSSSSISLNNSVDWHLPVFISQNIDAIEAKEKNNFKVKIVSKYEKLYSLGFISFYKKDKEFKVETKNKLLRDFLLTSPHRIVMDFSKDANMKSRVKKLDTKYYKKITFGSHKNYYRIVLELDGYYRYKKEKTEKGYSFFLY